MSAAEVREAAEALILAIGEVGAGQPRVMRDLIPPAIWEPIIDLAVALDDHDSAAEYSDIFGDDDESALADEAEAALDRERILDEVDAWDAER